MDSSMEKVRSALTGISGVPVTPYTSDGAVDASKLSTLIKGLAEAGVHNLMAAGNTGEFFTLTLEEFASYTARRSRLRLESLWSAQPLVVR